MADRLRQFGQEKYGTMAEFARALDMDPKDLNSYLSGRIGIGNKMRSRLEDKTGCSIVWLMTGRYPDLNRQRSEIEIEMQNRQFGTFLRSKNITTLEELEKMYEVYRAVRLVTDKSQSK